jgi:uncharacterized protein
MARLAIERSFWTRGLTAVGSAPRAAPGAGVLNFSRESFDAACTELLHRAIRDTRPDLIIGIPTGGLYVAQSMARAVGDAIPVLALTCRRPSSRLKRATSLVRELVVRLPPPVQDRLRLLEHRILTHGPIQAPQTPYCFDRDELTAFGDWLARAGERPVLLIVDDAVDTGLTLSLVLDAVRRRAPAAAIRSAVVTVTTDDPLVRPDYALYHRKLCRFPWSLDAATERLCSS